MDTSNAFFTRRCQVTIFKHRCLHDGQENSARCRSHLRNQSCIPDVVYSGEVKDKDCPECVMRNSGYVSDEIYMNTSKAYTITSRRDTTKDLKRPTSFVKSLSAKRNCTPIGSVGDMLARSRDIKSQGRNSELRYRRAIMKSRSENGYKTSENTLTNTAMKAPTRRLKMAAKKQLKSKKKTVQPGMYDGMEEEMDMPMEGYGDKDDVSDLSREMTHLTCDHANEVSDLSRKMGHLTCD
ncbi:hypothetical protein ACHAPC_000787 [Botrytis cinerea]|uniref:Uncharacterized protein n=2 Tax=Botryotinia fuckeliana TaxID=40559 RepID=G2XR72_BOTF4|nr:hypothetical protein BcDW1_1146 [Botrytis cinerea BcDW1]CCD43240.1 hypothetical protein BofuT4_P013490.1 [Botrytis cinerea T4]